MKRLELFRNRLYQKAKEDKERKFYTLHDKLCRMDIVQPETSSIQLGVNQPMKEPENIVTKWTYILSNRIYESSMGKAPVLERGGRAEVRVNNRAIVIVNELCSIVTGSTGIRFKWRSEYGEPFCYGRSQHLWTRLGKCIQRILRCTEDSTVVRIDGQTGMEHHPSASGEECRCQLP